MKWPLSLTAVGLAVVLAIAGCQKTTTVEGPGGRKLSVTKPSSVTIKQGTTEQIKISITRENFSDPVDVRFSNLPSGVTILEKNFEIPSKDNSATFTFKAADDAPLVRNHDATITVTGSRDLKQTETLPITVTKKS